MSWLTRIESINLFTEPEAWVLFKLSALAEALGWTLLILGIAINHYKWLGYKVAVPIAGRLHGTFFIMYFAILAVTYTSLNWPRKKFIVAIIAGVPPFGTLIFEQVVSFTRQLGISRRFVMNIVYFRVVNTSSK